MAEEDDESFASPEEEIRYWKEKASELDKEVKETRHELDEFQEGSRELEAELEMQLDLVEKKNKDLKSMSNRLQMENDQLKDKLEQSHREYNSRIKDLQDELSEIRSIKEKLHKYVRELEQENDDLERAKRSTVASLEDFEIRMNAAIERNVYLESELDEKEALKSAVQRLKDETKDLRSELKILAPDNDKAAAAVAPLFSPPSTPDSSTPNAQSPLAPSARISALNIVGDLLRKVGALELKLVSCRNMVKEDPQQHHKNGGMSINGGTSMNGGTPSVRGSLNLHNRIPRVASSPTVSKDS
ncbi:NDEL1 [Lepeophtheirus salmonis]|uniref:NDEL1 n=1 Tax=Lepeophtheirus salmonis TaxID=72036 RepID=A0A7R8CEL5_LEPSM|nr:NDEL1 [Lepeophtheirus salmonis]CAF2796828.1 NDEL1 [Lepeophtheirus salmonis]